MSEAIADSSPPEERRTANAAWRRILRDPALLLQLGERGKGKRLRRDRCGVLAAEFTFDEAGVDGSLRERGMAGERFAPVIAMARRRAPRTWGWITIGLPESNWIWPAIRSLRAGPWPL